MVVDSKGKEIKGEEEEETSTTTSLSEQEQIDLVNNFYRFLWAKTSELGIDPGLRIDSAINNMLSTMDCLVSGDTKLELLEKIKVRITMEESHVTNKEH